MTFWPTCEQTDPSVSGLGDLHFFRSHWAIPWVFCWNLAQSLDHRLAFRARAPGGSQLALLTMPPSQSRGLCWYTVLVVENRFRNNHVKTKRHMVNYRSCYSLTKLKHPFSSFESWSSFVASLVLSMKIIHRRQASLIPSRIFWEPCIL